MRWSFLLLSLSLALPAYADNRTEAIKLKHVSPNEVAQFLLHPPGQLSGGKSSGEPSDLQGQIPAMPWGVPGLAAAPKGFSSPQNADPRLSKGLLPDGIVAIVPNDQQGALFVTGSEPALEKVKAVVRLLDIPQQQVRLSVQALQLDDAAIRSLPLTPGPEQEPPVRTALLDAIQVAALLERAPKHLADTQADGVSNRPLYMFLPPTQTLNEGRLTLVPRVNGDRSVILIAEVSINEERLPKAEHVTLLRRTQAGQFMLGVWPSGFALLINAETQPGPIAPASDKR